MDTANLPVPGHSADVRMRLHINGHTLPIAQLGRNHLVLVEAAAYPPMSAEISLIIDGHERRWPVQLPDGLNPAERRTRLAPAQVNGTPD